MSSHILNVETGSWQKPAVFPYNEKKNYIVFKIRRRITFLIIMSILYARRVVLCYGASCPSVPPSEPAFGTYGPILCTKTVGKLIKGLGL